MSPLCILSFIFLVATTCFVSVTSSTFADSPCTPATCMNGPVLVSFTSRDCSGSGTFNNLFIDDPSTYGTCQLDSATSSHRIEVTSQFALISYVDNLFCDLTRSNASYNIQHYIFGKCNPLLGGTSSIVLANANATYTSPQPAPVIDLNNPDIGVAEYSAECQTTTNCTNDLGENPMFIIYYTVDDCSPISARGTYNNSFDGKTCYRQGEYYLTKSCLDEHARAERHYLDSDCQDMFFGDYYRLFCSNGQHYSCLATPIPLVLSPPSTPSAVPTSSATSALPTFFLLLLVHIIALLFSAIPEF